MHKRVLGWSRWSKRIVVTGLDVFLALTATWLAFSLRLDILHQPAGEDWWVYVAAPTLAVPIFVKFGLYRAIFRYSGHDALMATAKASVIYGAIFFVLLVWQKWQGVPRSLGLLQPLIFFLLVGGSRAFARFWLAGFAGSDAGHRSRLLIFGAGAAGVQAAAALVASRNYKLICFADDDLSKVGCSINGVKVSSAVELVDLVRVERISDVLLAMPSASRSRRRRIVNELAGLPVHVRSLPSMVDLASGRVAIQEFRELEIEDLLGRDSVMPDSKLLAQDLEGQTVLITGAGGSIGAELSRQILLQRPKKLLLFDHNEFGLYAIHHELLAIETRKKLEVEVIPLLGSVSEFARLESMFLRYRPATAYHAAAYKHVPLVESNPGEGVLNNIFGTLNVARACVQAGTHRFVLISTDKAVRPTNVMGATKRMAELVLQALAAQPSPTTFSMVRFGNVLGSSGSVVPLFRKQLAANGPLTVTHAEVTRYFMTIPEAAQLVLQAGSMGVGGDVFVLDMGQPIKILDLARRMIQLSGLSVRDEANPDGDIEIAITGLRPGEKLYEELLIGDNPQPTDHPLIMKAHEDMLPWSELEVHLSTLKAAAESGDVATIKQVLRTCVHGYTDEPQ